MEGEESACRAGIMKFWYTGHCDRSRDGDMTCETCNNHRSEVVLKIGMRKSEGIYNPAFYPSVIHPWLASCTNLFSHVSAQPNTAFQNQKEEIKLT